MTTYGATSDGNVVKLTIFSFQWHNHFQFSQEFPEPQEAKGHRNEMSLNIPCSMLTKGFPSQRATDAVLRCFLCCQPQQTLEQTVELLVIWDAKPMIWRHCNERTNMITCTVTGIIQITAVTSHERFAAWGLMYITCSRQSANKNLRMTTWPDRRQT